MRRKDREITDLHQMEEIIRRCDVCRLAFFDEEYPYILPINFGFERVGEGFVFYFHSAKQGKKLDLIRRDSRVSFELDGAHQLIEGEKACDYSMEYESVIGSGRAEILEGAEKLHALKMIMRQYAGGREFEIKEPMAEAVAIFRVVSQTVTAKALKKL